MRIPLLATLMTLALASPADAGTAERAPVLPFDLPEPDVSAACVADMEDAFQAMGADDMNAAVASFRSVTDACPTAGGAWFRLALLHADAGRLDEALASLQSAAALAPLWPGVAHEESLEALRESPTHAKRFAALEVAEFNMAPPGDTPDAATLGRTREEIERGVEIARTRVEAANPIMMPIQYEVADGAVALWEAASLDGLRERATTRAERGRLRWEALSALLVEDAWPRGGAVSDEILRRSRDPDLLDSEHWVGAEQAHAIARWIRDGLASEEGRADPALLERVFRELLEIAAASPDTPVLRGGLIALIDLSGSDLTLRSRLAERLLAVASDRDATEKLLRARYPELLDDEDGDDGAPAFVATTLDGHDVSPASLRGRPTLLHFWATWCQPCKRDLPAIGDLARADSDLRVIGVALEEEDVDADSFRTQAAERGVTWPQVLASDPNHPLLSAFPTPTIPRLVLLDPDGVVVARATSLEVLQPAIRRFTEDDLRH